LDTFGYVLDISNKRPALSPQQIKSSFFVPKNPLYFICFPCHPFCCFYRHTFCTNRTFCTLLFALELNYFLVDKSKNQRAKADTQTKRPARSVQAGTPVKTTQS